MKTQRWMQRGLGCLVFALIWHLTGSAFARPRPPGPPYPELHILSSFRFDNANLLTATNSSIFAHDVALVEGWSGYALSIEGNAPKMFAIPAVDGNAKTNFSSTTGTIRFWFRPSWSSSSLGGNGPGTVGRLFEIGTWTANQGIGCWSLQFAVGGDAISFVAGSGANCLEILRAPIQWTEGDWHQVAFSYSPAGSWLFLDGQMTAQGPAVGLTPCENMGGTFGFCLGSDVQGSNLAQGQFDELTIFKVAEDADHVAWNYSCLAGAAALGPITPDEDLASLAVAVSCFTLGETRPAPIGRLDHGGRTNGMELQNDWQMGEDPVQPICAA